MASNSKVQASRTARVNLPWTETEQLTAGDLRQFVRSLDRMRVGNEAAVTVEFPSLYEDDQAGEYNLVVEWGIGK